MAPDGGPLAIDVAVLGPDDADRVLILSSGLHGVEGRFGSAVQAAAMTAWAGRSGDAARETRPVRRIFVHALNPHGFAWSRRADAENIDPNRNFPDPRPDDDDDEGSETYARFDRLLNPRRPPSSWSVFPLRMLLALAIHGRPALKQALVAGQFEFPKGLFFGGHGPSASTRFVTEHVPRWIAGARLVMHLDLHTGLGPYATHKLLVDDRIDAQDRHQLVQWFGADAIEEGRPEGTSYRVRGSFPGWCRTLNTDNRRYLHACAEFGTFGNLRVLAGLRAENQAHHWTNPGDARRTREARRLQELFSPSSPAWRRRVIADGMTLVARALDGLSQGILMESPRERITR